VCKWKLKFRVNYKHLIPAILYGIIWPGMFEYYWSVQKITMSKKALTGIKLIQAHINIRGGPNFHGVVRMPVAPFELSCPTTWRNSARSLCDRWVVYVFGMSRLSMVEVFTCMVVVGCSRRLQVYGFWCMYGCIRLRYKAQIPQARHDTLRHVSKTRLDLCLRCLGNNQSLSSIKHHVTRSLDVS